MKKSPCPVCAKLIAIGGGGRASHLAKHQGDHWNLGNDYVRKGSRKPTFVVPASGPIIRMRG